MTVHSLYNYTLEFSVFLAAEIGGKSSVGQRKSNFGSGRETLRLRSNGRAKIEIVSHATWFNEH